MFNIYKICRLCCFTAFDFPQKNILYVLQGSVEKLFRIGKNRLYYFVANLFRIPHTKFYWNRPRFVKDTTQTLWLTFFLGHGVHVVPRCHIGLIRHKKYIIGTETVAVAKSDKQTLLQYSNIQVAQLSERDRAAGWVIVMVKSGDGTGRQYFTDIIGLSSTTVT